MIDPTTRTDPASIDVFVSYSSSDAEGVAPVVEALRQRGCRVWWSEDSLLEGRWDHAVEAAFSSAKRVLALISENVDRANRDYILAEIERARAEEKLIPFVIGEGGRSFAIRGLVALIQSYFFDDFDSIVQSAQFERLIPLIRGPGPEDRDRACVSAKRTPLERIDHWFSCIEQDFGPSGRIHAYALGLAFAIFENGPFSEVEALGNELASMLKGLELGEPELTDTQFPRRSSPLLRRMECELREIEHPVQRLNQTVVSFIDRERASSFVRFAWTEFGGRRPILRSWLASLVSQASSERQMRVGFTIGLLAQAAYIEVFEQIIRPWLQGEDAALRSVADIALSVAAFEPAVARNLERTIKDWAISGSTADKKAAVRLACGFTGARITGSAIATLRHTTQDSNSELRADLLRAIEQGLRDLLQSHGGDADTSLFNLHGLVGEITDWITDDLGEGNKHARNPTSGAIALFLFLIILRNLPLAATQRVKGRLSLDELMQHQKSAKRIARVFNIALARHRIDGIPTRDLATTMARRWIEIVRKARSRGKDDALTYERRQALLAFARALYATAPGQNDRDRVLFMFDSVLTPDDLVEHVNEEEPYHETHQLS